MQASMHNSVSPTTKGLVHNRPIPSASVARPMKRFLGKRAARTVARSCSELCDPFGKPLPGFESDRCRVVSGDRVDHVLRWEGAEVAPYQYNAVSLRLEVERGAIYNIYWRRDAT